MNKRENSGTTNILKIIVNIISWTCLVLLIVVAGFLLYYIISSQLYAKKGDAYAPKLSLYTIISPSMTPNINVYDIVIDERVKNPEDLKKGDIITFISTSSISNGMTITHRIEDVIETEDGIKYKTKGDANISADYALVTFDKVIGRVKFRIPQLGRVQFLLSSKGGWLVLILIPAIFIILADTFRIFNLLGIKKRVKNVEEEDLEEEEMTQEKLEQEYKKQQELKKQLQAKTNKTKYKKNEYESDGFLENDNDVVVSVSNDEIQTTDNLEETIVNMPALATPSKEEVEEQNKEEIVVAMPTIEPTTEPQEEIVMPQPIIEPQEEVSVMPQPVSEEIVVATPVVEEPQEVTSPVVEEPKIITPPIIEQNNVPSRVVQTEDIIVENDESLNVVEQKVEEQPIVVQPPVVEPLLSEPLLKDEVEEIKYNTPVVEEQEELNIFGEPILKEEEENQLNTFVNESTILNEVKQEDTPTTNVLTDNEIDDRFSRTMELREEFIPDDLDLPATRSN